MGALGTHDGEHHMLVPSRVRDTHIEEALKVLKENYPKLTRQQFKTLKGQILSGNIEGFHKGLRRINEALR